MIYTQLLWDLGYLGAIIRLTDDWRSNRHIQVKDDRTLCGLKLRKQRKVMKNGRFIGYIPDSYDTVWGFYGQGRCKECLKRYLRHRLSPKGKLMIRKAKALRAIHDQDRECFAKKAAHKARALKLLGLHTEPRRRHTSPSSTKGTSRTKE